jgi:Ca2+:H+ antiporter
VFCCLLSSTNTQQSTGSLLSLSRVAALLLVTLYGLFLHFQLKTHPHMFDAADVPPCEEEAEAGLHLSPAAPLDESGLEVSSSGDEDEIVLSFRFALIALGLITFLVSLLSDWIVGAIEGAASESGVPITFIAVVLLPVVDNVAEHASAIILARKNKLDVAIGIAVGSTTQISVGVYPACVLVGVLMGKELTLDLQPFETGVLVLTVLCLAHALADGRSHWLKGAALLIAYLAIAAAFYAHEDPMLAIERDRPSTP